MPPKWENYCTLDKNSVDAWGIPVLHIKASYGENELKLAEDMANSAGEMIEGAGAKNVTLKPNFNTFGMGIHEVGVARMGNDPKKSVLNKFCQSHDMKNLFVMDGGCFVSSGCQNPTLTMMALVCHSCAYLGDQFKKGEIWRLRTIQQFVSQRTVRSIHRPRRGNVMSQDLSSLIHHLIDRRQALRALVASSVGWTIGSSLDLFAKNPPRKILFFSKSSGFEHSAIRRNDNELSPAEKVLIELGKTHGFDVVATKDGSIFTRQNLKGFDAIFFYTTGDLTQAMGDKNPPMTVEGKVALLEAIRSGKGFLGTHSATDTFHSLGPEFETQSVERRDPYIQMIGGEFIRHGPQQEATMRVASPQFPGSRKTRNGIQDQRRMVFVKKLCSRSSCHPGTGDTGDGGNRLPAPGLSGDLGSQKMARAEYSTRPWATGKTSGQTRFFRASCSAGLPGRWAMSRRRHHPIFRRSLRRQRRSLPSPQNPERVVPSSSINCEVGSW